MILYFQSSLYSPDTVERAGEKVPSCPRTDLPIFTEMSEVFFLAALPGRTEIGGNHTDYECGRVWRQQSNLDMIAVVSFYTDHLVRLKSHGYNMDTVSIDELEFQQTGIRYIGIYYSRILTRFKELGHHISGFDAYTTSDVLKALRAFLFSRL